MNWLLMLNVLIIGGFIGWAVSNYLAVGLIMTLLVISLGGAAGLGLGWWLRDW
jgi:hypothetical protein